MSVDELSMEEVEAIWSDSLSLVKLANSRRLNLLGAPAQSNFRVHALLLVSSPAGRRILEGANSEPCYIGGSICAERSAITKMRFIPNCTLEKVVVVSDFHEPISPGALCREYIISIGCKSTIVVMGNNTSEKITQCSIGELFPFPCIYRLHNRADLLSFGESFSVKIEENSEKNPMIDMKMIELYNLARNYVRYDDGINLHPIQIASAVLYSDDTTDIAWQLKGAEYGCTLDSVSQLVGLIVRKCHIKNIDEKEQKIGIHDSILCSCNSSIDLINKINIHEKAKNTFEIEVGGTKCSERGREFVSNKPEATELDFNEKLVDDKIVFDSNNNVLFPSSTAVLFSSSPSPSPSPSITTLIGIKSEDGKGQSDTVINQANRNILLSSVGVLESYSPIRAVMIVSVDQFGIAHAPHGQARALLVEHGCSDVIMVVHDDDCMLNYITAAVLLPPPKGATLLSHDNFI